MVRRSRAVRAPGPEPSGRAARASSSSRSRRGCATWFAESARCPGSVQPFRRGPCRRPPDRARRRRRPVGPGPDRRRPAGRGRAHDALDRGRPSSPTSTGAGSARPWRSRTPRRGRRGRSPTRRGRAWLRRWTGRRSGSTTCRSTSATAPRGTGWCSMASARSRGARWRATARSPGASGGRARRARSAGRWRATPSGSSCPCHRVIAGDGSLGGYGVAAWGGREAALQLKRELLALEGVHIG